MRILQIKFMKKQKSNKPKLTKLKEKINNLKLKIKIPKPNIRTPKKLEPVVEKFRVLYKKCAKRYFLTIAILAILLFIVIETLARHSLLQSLGFLIQHPLICGCNILLIFALMSISILFKRRAFVTIIITILWLALGITNGIILTNRMTPFTVKDISNFKDGLAIMTTYISIPAIIGAVVCIAVVVFGLMFLFKKAPKQDGKVNYKKAGAILAIIVLATFGSLQVATRAGILDTFFANLAYGYRDNGVPYCFMVTWLDGGIDKPKGYSEGQMESIFVNGELGDDKIYTPGEDDQTKVKNKPNIIYLQLESFIDPERVEGLKFNKKPAPYHEELMKNYSSGYLKVPAVGAGTANVEFESMTGISVKSFGPGEYPYKSVLKDETCETAAYDLKQLGYGAHAIHNHRGVFYGRNNVFGNMGYDTFTSLEYMNNVTKTPKNWAEDNVLTEQIMDALNSTEQSDYIYTISVQGHGQYPEEEVLLDPEITVEGAETEELKWQHEYYANQIYEMDNFMRELTGVLENFDEDVVLVMYGDHLPAINIPEDKLRGGDVYQTEYIIWDNFGMKKEDKDLHAYEINAEVLKRVGISVGMLTKYHQNYKGSEDYIKNLEALAYDMLYGKRYIYGQKNPFPRTDMRMGIKDIKIDEVVKIGDEYYIKGQNFTEFSKISLDGEVLKTVYLGPGVLALKDKIDIEDAKRMKVSQVERDKTVLSTTE